MTGNRPNSNYHCVTVTKREIRHCAWCGGVIPDSGGPGRPRRYCRRSHRQRAFEARRLGSARGLSQGEAVISTETLASLRDRLYVLETAMEDGAGDLRGSPTPHEIRAAYDSLASAAGQVLEISVEPTAVGG